LRSFTVSPSRIISPRSAAIAAAPLPGRQQMTRSSAYTIGRFYGKGGVPYLGTRPSKKAVRRLLARVHDETSSQWNWQTPAKRVSEINPILRGWCAYFSQGPVARVYRLVRRYTERRVRKWLMRRRQKGGTGYKQYPDRYLYDTLGLFMPPGHVEREGLMGRMRAGCGSAARPVRRAGCGNGSRQGS
jgi:hypothetical protein